MNPFERLLCGGVAGITSVVCTYPLDIVRTRLSIQTASFAALGGAHKDKIPGMWTTLVGMYKSEGGMAALYRGIIPTVSGVAPYVRPCADMVTADYGADIYLGRLKFHDI